MIEPREPVGILSLRVVTGKELVAPEQFISDAGLRDRAATALRIRTKSTLPAGVQLDQCEDEAAAGALADAAIDASEIDLLIHASSTPASKSLYSKSARLIKSTGARRAYGFDVMAGCNGATWAIANARSLLLTQPEWRTAMIVIGDQLSPFVDYTDPLHLPLYSWADGASALLLRKGERRLEILAQAFKTDSTYGDSMYMPKTAATLTMVTSDEIEDGIKRTYKQNYAEVILSALQKAGVGAEAVAGVLMNQGDWRLIDYLSSKLGIPASVFQRTYDRFGHVGGSDPLLGLRERLDAGQIAKDDRIVLASSAIGFSWGALVLKA